VFLCTLRTRKSHNQLIATSKHVTAYPKILISGGMVKLLKDGQTDGEGEIISVSESNEEGRRLLRIRKGSSNAHCGFRRKLRRFFRRWRFHKNDKHKKCFCHLNKVYRVNKVGSSSLA
jgi:hypothetical protein